MSDQASADADMYVDDEGHLPVIWEAPEIAAIVILVAFGFLVLGGLISGIVASTATTPAPTTSQFTGAVITQGAEWADPLLAIALLGVTGICWWQRQAWTLESDPHVSADVEILGHLDRARRIGLWTQLALMLTVAGSIASLVGTVMAGLGGSAEGWSRYVFSGTSLVAVIVIAGGGSWISYRAAPRT